MPKGVICIVLPLNSHPEQDVLTSYILGLRM